LPRFDAPRSERKFSTSATLAGVPVAADVPIECTVYPDDCDAFGHLNQASFLRLFERARWAALAAGPGMDAFERSGAWPAVRKTTIEYLQPVFPGERLRFALEITRLGHTSFDMRQTVRRATAEGVVAAADFVFVCVGTDGRPVPVPAEVAGYFGARSPRATTATQRHTVQGVTLAVDVSGDGPALLLVHGFPLDRTLWRSVTSTLTGWRRIVPDLRGMGLSEAPDGDYTMAMYADDLAALLDALHVETAVVCGLSMGGYVAFELLRRHRDRIRALVLMNTRATADGSDARARREAMMARVRRDGTGFLAEEMLPKLIAPVSHETMPEVVRHVRMMAAGSAPHGIVGALAAMRDRTDAGDLLATIGLPTLVVAGSEDQLIPLAEARAMSDAIRGAHWAVIPAAGHLVPVEQPVATGRVLREFLEALPQT